MRQTLPLSSRLWRHRTSLLGFTVIAATTTAVASLNQSPFPMAASSATLSTTVTKLPGKANVPAEAASNPHHVLSRGGSITGFKNPYPSYTNPVTPVRLLRKVFWPILTGDISYPDLTNPGIPVVKPEWLPSRTASSKIRATWLGHACYYVEFPSGLRVLFDPVFEDRCSPFSFTGPKRFTPPPCQLGDIPVIDAVVISHSHYDHLSHTSVLEIQKRHPEAHFFVGLGLESWFRSAGLQNVTELDWWEDADLKVSLRSSDEKRDITAKISCLPCQHTSARSPFDKDTTLWCSWAVSTGDKSVWFGGDTGYRTVPQLPANVDDWGPEYESLPRCPQFKQIGELRGPFDLGLIPIGAYAPRVAFSCMHANPFDSVEIFQDTACKRAMGIHWGTWALTTEEVTEPPAALRDALKRKGLPETGLFDVCDIGESREF